MLGQSRLGFLEVNSEIHLELSPRRLFHGLSRLLSVCGCGWGVDNEIIAAKILAWCLYTVGAQQMPVSFSLPHTLKGGGNLICETQKHLHDLKINVPSPGVVCTFPHCVCKELCVITSGLKFEAERVSPPRDTPPYCKSKPGDHPQPLGFTLSPPPCAPAPAIPPPPSPSGVL